MSVVMLDFGDGEGRRGREISTHIGVSVRGLGRFEQAETHDIAYGCEAILGVIEDRDAVAVLGQVSPFVAAHFELGHVPAAVE